MPNIPMETVRVPHQQVKRACLIVTDGDLNTIVFKFPINPESFTDSHAANFTDHPVIGRSHPKSQWVNSGARAIGYTLHLDSRVDSWQLKEIGVVHRGPVGGFGVTSVNSIGVNPLRKTLNEIENRDPKFLLMTAANFLRALVKPKLFIRNKSLAGDIYSSPPVVLFVWGQYFRIRCIVRNVEVEWLQFTSKLDPVRARVTMELHEQPIAPVSFQDYLVRGDQRDTGEAGWGC